jgi:hypothetical protein
VEYVICLVFVEQKMIGVRRGMVLSSIDALSLSLLIYYAVRAWSTDASPFLFSFV